MAIPTKNLLSPFNIICKNNAQKKEHNQAYCSLHSFCVGVSGLEPEKAGPESAVLPLHHTPMSKIDGRILLFLEYGCKIKAFY